MMLEDRFFEQEWVQELSDSEFRMLLYLLHFASKKTGIVELNMRMINFAANTAHKFTKEDVLDKFGKMIKLIPGKENTAIFPDYIATNWAKDGKPIDTVRNPLFKSIVRELERYGLTITDVNAMSSKKIEVREEYNSSPTMTYSKPEPVIQNKETEELFNSFWEAYPSNCPRKVDKKKCFAKFETILNRSKDSVQTFNHIMHGLDVWKSSDMWKKDNGQFIRAPLVWLNNESWKDTPLKGVGNGNQKQSANTNYTDASANGIF